MKINFIKLKQKSEVLFLCKINPFEMRDQFNFEFRDPYYQYKNYKDIEDDIKFSEEFYKRGIDIQAKNDSSQRKLKPKKISSIKKFLETNEMNFFPSSILLSLNIKDKDTSIIETLENNEIGVIELGNEYRFNIIDGQHRLAGILDSDLNVLKNFEIPVVLLVDIAVSYATKIFLDINENQTSVNKSLVYDLYEDIDDNSIYDIRKIHTVCQKLYQNDKSPLYKQIKMLGVGSGAISQAFFIDSVIDALKSSKLLDLSTQSIYTILFHYFRAYQRVFQREWPVLLDENKEKLEYSKYTSDEYAEEVLKIKKSQLVKTTGFGAIMLAFPYIHKMKNENKLNYFKIIKILENKIYWTENIGTGKSAQNNLSNKIIEILKKSQ